MMLCKVRPSGCKEIRFIYKETFYRVFTAMPAYCAVLKCKSKGSMPERSFFRFPMINNATTKSMALTQARQQAWITAINRVD